MAIARNIKVEAATDLVADAFNVSQRMPDLLLEARRIANNVMSGWHGRRKRGNGDNFWQFRPYVEGEPLTHIDWRRSARDDHIFLRDREWVAAQTVWIAPDQSLSMHYQSRFSDIAKVNYAMLVALSLAELFSRAGERVGVPDLLAPVQTRDMCEQMALAFLTRKTPYLLPDFYDVSRYCHVIIISDFLDDPNEIGKKFDVLADKHVNAHFIEICDPAEERFPYHGRVEFIDPETEQKFLAGRAQKLHDAYSRIYHARRQTLADFANNRGFTYHISPTDRPVSEVILALANIIGAASGYRRG